MSEDQLENHRFKKLPIERLFFYAIVLDTPFGTVTFRVFFPMLQQELKTGKFNKKNICLLRLVAKNGAFAKKEKTTGTH